MPADLPLVTAVIPTYNYGHYVCAAVESALAQTYPRVEVVVVDDGSTDDTAARLARYGDRIRYVYQPNQGLSAARNTGIRAANGEFVALLDSDDEWHPERVAAQVPVMLARPEVGLVAAGAETGPEPRWKAVDPTNPGPAREVTARELLVRTWFGSCGVLMRRACFDEVGYFDTTLRSAEDRDMWLRVALRYPIVVLGAPLWWYRAHSGSMSTAAQRMEDNELRVLRRALDAQRAPFWLRRKVIAYTLKSAAYRHATAGNRAKAIGHLLKSFALWPLPFRAHETNTPGERLKMLVLFAARAVRARAAPSAP
jgi:glycosyltransferase involved in cell wall biosynthesis